MQFDDLPCKGPEFRYGFWPGRAEHLKHFEKTPPAEITDPKFDDACTDLTNVSGFSDANVQRAQDR
ncbi:hypothetical protein [uncultured Marivita sp.]|uniref:hypothetical protein n=1 Tax=uncultured Marivita sp. TaxID=888080 RepID=UPI00262D59B0|nr:hypothetical protein [uncultured Marivita sp.]